MTSTIKDLKILSFLPIFVLFIGIIIFTQYSYNTLKDLDILKTSVKESKNIALLINELQRERGLSIGFLSSHGEKYKISLINQRNKVNNIYNEENISNPLIKNNIRILIDNFVISDIDVFNYFTKKIRTLLDIYMSMTVKIPDTYVNNNLQAYIVLSVLKESLAQIRGTLNGIISSKDKEITNAFYYKLIYAKGIYDMSKYRFAMIASPQIIDKFNLLIHSDNYNWIEKMMERYIKFEHIKYVDNALIWWDNVTQEINNFYTLEKEYFLMIDKYVKSEYRKTLIKLALNGFIFVFLIIIIVFLSYKIKDNIIKNVKLLNEYKNAVDRSSIVSKTDARGLITYVNDKFCDISGYHPEELIGKSHSIIRHPDISKEFFRHLWKTILNKESWTGIVKNKKKDGGFYIVEATINPILNHKGEVEEYIAIRHDITKTIRLYSELEESQKDLIITLAEISEVRSTETGYHIRRVAKYSELLAKYYGLGDKIKYLSLASSMHDIGKIGIPDNILNKKGKLTDAEWEIMKTHTKIGYDLFKDTNKPLLQAAATIAYEHHEKYDGSGYPRGLVGEEIDIFARITALADVFDALSSKRCYKEAWENEKIFQYIQEERGKHFDPILVDIFFEHLDEFLAIGSQYKDLS